MPLAFSEVFRRRNQALGKIRVALHKEAGSFQKTGTNKL
uniref:Uncharacterized protein n=1 Tax=Tetraselmis sp. GSL018 TaxID=582737 RepID=A0A061R9Z7_9CHLO